ncbi:MAG: TraD N-terminal domain-containing protein [Candidatus Tisiphia sp.]
MSYQNQNNFTRGSQIFAHQMRMLGQGSINALMIGAVSVLAWLMLRIFQKLSLLSLYYFIIERYVQLKLVIGQYFYSLEQIGIEFYYIEYQVWQKYCLEQVR